MARIGLVLALPAVLLAQQAPAVDVDAAAVEQDAHSLCLPTGPPPKDGYDPYPPVGCQLGQTVIVGVPAYLWRHGCGPTAAGMVIGYWDGNGFGALIPGDASTQTNEVNQAIATGDGANTHYSDYSLPKDYSPDPIQPDLSEPPDGDEHPSDCLGDFMKTSWSAANNYYGWSWFSDVDNSLLGYVDYANAAYGAGYQADSWNEYWGTFTWAKFAAEIDAARPLVFLVDTDGNGGTDHFVTAIGYRDTSGYEEYACLDTWSTGLRWERFRGLAAGNAWGIYGATYFVPEPPDADGDGVPDSIDNCPDDYNPEQVNSDGDSHGDACDNCPTDDNENQANSDADSHGDACDNCPNHDNEDQADCDDDGMGDVCAIADGYSEDCNRNGVPDECETLGSIVYVDDSATGANDGTSWTDAFTELQSALSAASCFGGSVTQIWVAQGTYLPDYDPDTAVHTGDREATFQLLNGVALYGGFPGTPGTEGDFNTRDPDTHLTTLSGDLADNDGVDFGHLLDCFTGPGVPQTDPDCLDADLDGDTDVDTDDLELAFEAANNDENSYHVVTGSGTDGTALLDGFTIMGGNASGGGPSNSNRGGGMLIDGGSPSVAHCTFSANSASDGGGIYNLDGSSSTVTDCTLSGNIANDDGGGMTNLNNSNPTVTNCTFTANTANDLGGGMVNNASSPTVTGCTFDTNTTNNAGGGMCNVNASSPPVIDCRFTTNSAGLYGGGMYNESNSPTIRGCTYHGNNAVTGGGMYNTDSRPIIMSCSFTDNNATAAGGMININYSDATVVNCVFVGNTSTGIDGGGGMCIHHHSNPILANCTFIANTANEDGGGILNLDSSNPTVANCIFWANSDSGGMNMNESAQIHVYGGTPTITYSCIQGCDTFCADPDDRNIGDHPLFADADGRLSAGSPCVDTGNNAALPPDAADLDGDGNTNERIPLDLDSNHRVINCTVDMGAYEFVRYDDDPGLAPMLCSAISRKTHGGAGEFDLHLPLAGSTECRVGDADDGFGEVLTKVILLFSEPVQANDGSLDIGDEVTLATTPAGGSITGLSLASNELTIDITGVVDQSCVTITVETGSAGITDLTANSLTGTNQAHIGVLYGDVDGDGNVTLTDFLRAKDNNAQPVNWCNNARCDVDRDNNITLTDFLKAKDLNAHTVTCP